MDLALLVGSPDEVMSTASSQAPSPSENSATSSNVQRGTSYGGRMERSLDTYGNKKGKGGSAPSSARREGSPAAASTTPTMLLKGLRDPGRSYEDLLADSPPAHLHTPMPQTQTQTKQQQQQQQQQPWSLLMRRQLAEALSHQSSSSGGDSPLASYCSSPPADTAVAAQLQRAQGGLLLSAVVRPMTPAEAARGAKEVLVVAPDARTLLVVRPDVFQGAPAEHVAAAAAAYGQSGWATRYKFHLCLKGSYPPLTRTLTSPAADDAGAVAGLEAAASKTKAAIAALASSLAEAVLSGQSSACLVYGAAGSGSSACYLESAAGAADGLAAAAFREVGK